MRLHDFLDYWARLQPEAEFAVQGSQRVTWGTAITESNRLAHAIRGAGLRAGDRMAILAKNSIEYLYAYLAASKAGVVLVPLNYRLAPPEWAYILNDARPRLLLAAEPYHDAMETLRPGLPSVERFVSLGSSPPTGWECCRDWVMGQSATAPSHEAAEHDDLYQMYTSGTTGHPKGAVLQQRAVVANIVQSGLAFGVTPGERCLVALPLFHAAVVPTAFTPLAHGGSLYLLDDFTPAEAVRALSEGGIAFATLVPAMLQACLVGVPDIAERRFDMLRLLHYGASPIAEPTLRRAITVFGCGFVQSYGMTEATQALTYLTPADHEHALAGHAGLLLAAGRPAAGTEIRVVDPDNQAVPPGSPGEIVARGPQLMRCYWNMPEVSAEVMRGGWLHTGDVGVIDADGYLYVQDRLKDMIVSGGENVYPRAVEDVLFRHLAVADVAVIGVPDDRWGETVKAVVVLRPGERVTAEEIMAFCRDRLGGFECPRSVDFVDALPRNPSGKVLKRMLREPYWAGRARRVAGA